MYLYQELSSFKKSLLKQFTKLRGMDISVKEHTEYFKYLTDEFLSQQNLFASLLGEEEGLSFEGLKLLVHHEKKERESKNEVFECYVIHINELSGFLKMITQPENIPAKSTRRLQAIIGVGEKKIHYATCDFELSAKERNCFLLDAANAILMIQISEKINQTVDKDPNLPLEEKQLTRAFYAKNETNAGPQRDFISCPIHAFYHACESSKVDIFPFLAEKANPRNHFFTPNAIIWMRLPPEFVILAEKEWWLKVYRDYHTVNPKEKNSYAQTHPGFAEIKAETTGLSFNDVIDSTANLNREGLFPALAEFKKFQKKIIPFILNTSDQELDNIINQSLELRKLETLSLADQILIAGMLEELDDILKLHEVSSSDSEEDKLEYNSVSVWTSEKTKNWSSIINQEPPFITSSEYQGEENFSEIDISKEREEGLTIAEIKSRITRMVNESESLDEFKKKLQPLLEEIIKYHEKILPGKTTVEELKKFLNTYLIQSETVSNAPTF